MNDSRIETYREIYSDVWRLFKASLPAKNTDDYWDDLISQSSQLTDRYKNGIYANFAKEQAVAVVNELERIARREKMEDFTATGTTC